jgi:two-component system sensor histidine kinase FlrB
VLHGQCIEILRPDRGVVLRGNRKALVGAILNLATNALQAAGEHARVRIQAIVSGAQLARRVADNGPGVPAADRPRIFDPFFTSRPDGTGLGLAVARSVAKAHKGDIKLEECSARGATFVVRLPVCLDLVDAVGTKRGTGAQTRKQTENAAA